MMIGIHGVLVFSAAGEVLGVDGVRAGLSRWRLGVVWGAVLVVAGLVAMVRSLGDPVFAGSGTRLGGPDFAISLGSYNLAGAVLLVVCGADLLVAEIAGSSAGAVVSLAVGAGAALLLYVQLVFTDPWLGGSNTSAAFFLCAAVIGWAVLRAPGKAGSEVSSGTGDARP